MFRYAAQRTVQRELDDVFAYLADVRRQTEWVHGVTRCQWIGDPTPRVGAKAEQAMTFMGKQRVVPLEVVDFEAGRRIIFRKDEPFPIRFGFELEPRTDGSATHVRYPVEMAPRGLTRIVIHFIGRKTIDGDLQRIAAHLETAVNPRAASRG